MCKQGQQANKFFIILSGSLAVRLFIPAAKAELTLNSMDAGTSFGQLGLLRHRPVRRYPEQAGALAVDRRVTSSHVLRSAP